MIIKLKLASGITEVFEKEKYTISALKEFHPILCSVQVFDNGKKIFQKKRPFCFFYKKFIFKSAKVQNLLKEITENEMRNKSQEDSAQ